MNQKYSMSFTAGSLLQRESILLAQAYLELKDWQLVKDHSIQTNILQARTISSLKRISVELINRLTNLRDSEIELLVDSNSQNQAYLLWAALCRRHTFIADFAVEVLREFFLSYKGQITVEDYESFFHRKAEWHEELENMSPSSKYKVRQVLFKMMREVGLLTAHNMINPSLPSPKVLQEIQKHNPNDVLVFPMFEADLKRLLTL